jgi:cytochrome P450
MCVGQLLTRLEGETLLTAFSNAFSAMEPDGDSEPLFNNTLRGWVRMPVSVTRA